MDNTPPTLSTAGLLPTTPQQRLTESLAQLPNKPGVYRFFDKAGNLLYVGKSKCLKKRVSSYFHNKGKHSSPKTERLVSQLHTMAITIVPTEHEALILEDNLIKAHLPPYNICLRDDKRYPWVCITGEPYPRVVVTRGVSYKQHSTTSATPAKKKPRQQHRRKARYFGPYSRSSDMYDLLRIIRQHFPVRQRKTPLFTDRPCMNYSINTCPGPCQKLITEEDYEKTIQQIALLLKGQLSTLLDKLNADMHHASDTLNFEWAAQLRDRHTAVSNLQAMQQVVHLPQPTNRMDVIGLAHDDTQALLVVWQVRKGRVVGTTTHRLPAEAGSSQVSTLLAFLPQYYAMQEPDNLPDDILLPTPVPTTATLSDEHAEDWDLLNEWLHQTRPQQKRLQWHHPQRGDKATLLQQANHNAQAALTLAQHDQKEDIRRDTTKVLAKLQQHLNLPTLPNRMECYDISHVQGTHTVASMVVFTHGKAAPSQYRRFNIKTAEGAPDDFASMHEALLRRANHLPENLPNGADLATCWPTPDLIVIDGGKGQLSAARSAMEAAGMGDIPTISLAKRLEEVFMPGQSTPLRLPRDDESLYLLQHLRDEAHRFAITSHRKRRGKAATTSVLNDISGVGKKRQAQLLHAFGSMENLRSASAEAIRRKANISAALAQTIWEYLQANSDEVT